MMKRRILSKKLFFGGMIGVLFLSLCVGILFSTYAKKFAESYFSRMVRIGEENYALERADTVGERGKGLGGRDSLCEACGMLFIFESPGRYAFWMKDMRFPLDIIWLSGETVVFVAHDIQPDFPGIIEPIISADRVIEVNAGAAKSLTAGERVKFSH